MASLPEFSTVIYKILKYLDECQKRGCEPNFEIAQDLVKVNDKYFRNAIEEMERKELITREVFYADNMPYFESIKITIDGSVYLRENSTMQKISRFIDKVFVPELNALFKLAMA
jgi:hypothetical protein